MHIQHDKVSIFSFGVVASRRTNLLQIDCESWHWKKRCSRVSMLLQHKQHCNCLRILSFQNLLWVGRRLVRTLHVTKLCLGMWLGNQTAFSHSTLLAFFRIICHADLVQKLLFDVVTHMIISSSTWYKQSKATILMPKKMVLLENVNWIWMLLSI